MQENTLDRRLKLLKLEGEGFTKEEITRQLTGEYDVTARTIRYDFEQRGKWQPKLKEMEQALLQTLNRHDQLYRKAVMTYLQASKPSAQMYALNLLRSLNKDRFEMLQSSGVIVKAKDQLEISGEPLVVEVWQEEEDDESASGKSED